MWERLGIVVAAVAAAFVVTGAGQHRPVTEGPEEPAAAEAVAVLTGHMQGDPDGDPIEALPDDFAEVVGYQPAVAADADGSSHPVKPAGSCSSPFGATSFDFDRPCRTHDLGYELLRYATASGGELGPWARRAVDQHLADEMHARCDAIDGGVACHTTATLTSAVVKANSWRQGQGNPGSEELAPYLAGAAMVVAAAVGPPVGALLQRRRGRRVQAVAHHPGAVR